MDLRDLLSEYRIRSWEHGEHKNVRAGFIGVDCPWCGTRDKAHLGLRIGYNYGSCWQCGSHSLPAILHEITRRPYREILGVLPDSPRLPVERTVGRLALPRGVGELLPVHRDYLRRRNLDPEEMQRVWKVQGIGLVSKYKWRLFLPVQLHGEIVSWTTRAVGNDPVRYLSAPPEMETVSIKSVLYGADLCRHGIVIVEGPMDAMRGGPGFAASFGLGLTSSQMWIASRFSVRAICYDNEPRARRIAHKTASALAAYPGETHVIRLETGKDLNEAEQAEIDEIRKGFL